MSISNKDSAANSILSFKGRINRADFWRITLTLFLINFIFGFIFALINKQSASNEAIIILIIFVIPFVWAAYATYAKRWHDLGKSGWMSLALFVPLVNILAILYLGIAPGSTDTNNYGESLITGASDIQRIKSKTSELTNKTNHIVSNLNNFQKVLIVCSIATIIGLFSVPYGYYILLRVLFFGTLIYFSYEYQKDHETTGATLIILIVLIILYNPVFLVQLGSKVLWALVNIGTIGYLYWLTAYINNRDKPNKSVKQTD